MSVTVVDASAIAAVLFDEPESEPVLASVRGALIAPTLLPYEVASVCTTKLARHPAQAKTTLARYGLLRELDIELIEPEWETVSLIAQEWMLSAYDSCYLQLALGRKALLVTLDARLAAAYDRAAARG